MPHADLLTTLLPALLVLVGALAALGAEAFLSREEKHAWLPWISAVFLVLAAVALPFAPTGHLYGMLANDGARAWLQFAVIAATFISIGGLQQSLSRDRFAGGEPYAMTLFAAFGVLIMVMATDLIALFIGLETASLAVYALVGLRRHRGESNEAMFKYLVMGAVFSGLFLYGAALHYGATGSTAYNADVLAGRETYAGLSLAFLVIGLLFKVGAVPFHFWSPDAYTGAAAAITGFMGAVIKVGGFTALGALWLSQVSATPGPLDLAQPLTVSAEALKTLQPWAGVILMVAVLSLVIGNYAALKQRTSVRRLMAFSSVAHAGYMLFAFLLPEVGGQVDLLPLWIYLVGYAIATAGALSAIAAMSGSEDASDSLEGLAGQARAHPLPGIVLTILVASMAGLPPTLGFLGKFSVLAGAVNAGYVYAAIVAVLMAVVGAAYYMRLLVAVWGSAPKEPAVQGSNLLANWGLVGAAVAVIVLLAPVGFGRAAPTAQAAVAAPAAPAAAPAHP